MPARPVGGAFLYGNVAAERRRRIARGVYAAGAKIPSQAELSASEVMPALRRDQIAKQLDDIALVHCVHRRSLPGRQHGLPRSLSVG